MTKKTVLVTGGAGFIGSHLCLAVSNQLSCMEKKEIILSLHGGGDYVRVLCRKFRRALGAAYRVYRNGGMIAVAGRIKSKFRVRHHKE